MGESHFTKGTVQTAVEPSSPDKDRAVSQGRERKAVVSGIFCPLAVPPALEGFTSVSPWEYREPGLRKPLCQF